ncbi:MAG: TIGR00730 family Rossman fold protein [Silicimonas sp.]|nr:TIGR00730 family Rossman fold protein [Silicimonas sp.]
MPSPQFSICVYCGARPGTSPVYMEAAQAMGALIGKNGWRLVFGAGDRGIMGAVADAARAAGARTLGVIPTHLIGQEMNLRRSDQIITETMHERKKVMLMNADAVAVLPGGAGSLDEFFEVLTWAQLGLHDKPIVLVDVGGYWEPLVALIDHVIDQGFADASMRGLFRVASDVGEVSDLVK